MARPRKVRFAAYRRFDAAREEANNAMVALLVGSRLAGHTLQAHAGSHVLLPEIFPAVTGIDLLNRTVQDAQALLAQAERHLAYMAIPFVQSVFEDLVDSAVAILKLNGASPIDGDARSLSNRLGYIADSSGMPYNTVHVELIDFLRQMRNTIIHDGARATEKLGSAWGGLTPQARAEWEVLAKRTFATEGDAERRITAGSPELIVSLGVTNRIARELNAQLAEAVSSATWAAIAFQDFGESHPLGTRPRPTLKREFAGFVRFNYAGARIDKKDVATALAAATP